MSKTYLCLYKKRFQFSTHLNRIHEKLLHKNNFFTISHIQLLKYWPSDFSHVVKKLIFEGQYHYHSWRYHILDMFFFNCIRISSPLSSFSFQVDLVADIKQALIYCRMTPWLTMPNSSGEHPSGLATSK